MAYCLQIQVKQVFSVGIAIRNVSFSYPGKDILKGIDMDIEDGDFAGITGSTGSGKTTLAYCLNGLIPHSIRGKFSGKVHVNGFDTTKEKISRLSRKVGFVFQDPDWQIFSLTVKDEVAFGLKNIGARDIDSKVMNALIMVELDGMEEMMPQNLSHGQKQKLCIASVLAMDPDIIVMDEPTSQLDYRSTMNVYGILKKLNESGKTIIVIEHNTDLISEYANRVFILDNGTIIKEGSPKKVLSDRKLMEKLGIKIPWVYRK